MAENKEARFATEGLLYNYMGTAPWENNNIYDVNNQIGTSITQGTGQGQRVGNKIRLKKYNLKYRFWPGPANPNNLFIKMWVLTDRQNPTTQSRGSVNTAALSGPWFNQGSSSTGMTGKVFDVMLPMDTDRWRVYKTCMWKIGVSSNPQATVTGLGNNDFSYSGSLNINLTKYMPKIIRFRDTETTVQSKQLFVVFQVVKADNTIDPTDVGHISFSRVVEMKWEDV